MRSITGNLKITFFLLVVAIFSLMTYSYHYQSSSLVTSRSRKQELNSTLSHSIPQVLYVTSTKDASRGPPPGLHRYATKELMNEHNTTMEKVNDTDSQTALVISREKSIPEASSHTLLQTNLDTDVQAALAISREKSTPEANSGTILQTTLEHTTPDMGYIVVLNIYEQQTMASGNLLQLQCWARCLNLKVVKPFMRNSNMATPLDEKKQLSMLKMEDTFDMHDWERYTNSKGYSPLVEWEEFVKSAPRKLIVIQTKYPTITHVKGIRKKGLPFPHPPSPRKLYAEGCMFKFLKSKGMQSMQARGFVIVRKVCLNFLTGDELSMEQLQDHILGEFKNERVSILLDEWRGLGENQRFLVQEDLCRNTYAYKEHTKPSARIMRDTDLYIQQYLGGSNSSYVAAMARYEMTGLTKHMSREDDQYAIIPKCLQVTREDLAVVKSVKHAPQAFLSIDVGKYGSDSFRNKKYFGHLSEMEEFVERVTRMKIGDWERTFELVANTQDSGYIAMLQLVLVTRAKCILFVGGGTFQRHALHLYQELHPSEEERCVRVVEKCTSQYRPLVK